MNVQLRHNPSFTVARCILAGNEVLNCEAGAMIAHSGGVELESKSQGGIMKGLKRSVLGGGSFFVTTFTAPPQGGWVDVAGVLPGDTVTIDVTPEQPFFLRKGSWIANSSNVQVDTQWGGMANLFGGEGGFGFRASGQGEALVSIYGAVDVMDLEAGETVTIDTGHVVAYELSMKFTMRRAAKGRTMQSLKSGEGWVFDFDGPGRVLLQSRNPEAFAHWVAETNPGDQPREGIGGLGGSAGGGIGRLFN